jgi:hypothetical protein
MLAGFNFIFIKQLLINKYASLSVVSAADLIKAVRITAALFRSLTPDLPHIKSWGAGSAIHSVDTTELL